MSLQISKKPEFQLRCLCYEHPLDLSGSRWSTFVCGACLGKGLFVQNKSFPRQFQTP